MGQMLSDMAKVWGGDDVLPCAPVPASLKPLPKELPAPRFTPAPAPAPAPAAGHEVVVHSSFPASHAVLASISPANILCIKCHGLAGTISSISDPLVDLSVSAGQVVFQVGQQELRVSLQTSPSGKGGGGAALDPATTKAGFKKKAGVLTVEVSLL